MRQRGNRGLDCGARRLWAWRRLDRGRRTGLGGLDNRLPAHLMRALGRGMDRLGHPIGLHLRLRTFGRLRCLNRRLRLFRLLGRSPIRRLFPVTRRRRSVVDLRAAVS